MKKEEERILELLNSTNPDDVVLACILAIKNYTLDELYSLISGKEVPNREFIVITYEDKYILINFDRIIINNELCHWIYDKLIDLNEEL